MGNTTWQDTALRAVTPAYVFDKQELEERVTFLREKLPKGAKLCFAIKANPFLAEALRDEVDCFEVCSPGEARICLRAGVPKEKLVISGVYKTPEVMEELAKDADTSGIIFTVESKNQACLLSSIAVRYKISLPVLIRMTSGNQFGMDPEDIRVLVKEHPSGLVFCGLQFYSGTQKTSVKRLRREMTAIAELMQELREIDETFPDRLEFGPGLPVTYFEGESLDEEAYYAELSALFAEFFPHTHLTVEAGRGLAACCGTYLTRVVDVKENRGEKYAICDGGIHQLVYYGQMMAMKRPHLAHFPEREGVEENWNLCGSLCTVNDVLLKQLPVKDLQVGDTFAFFRTGAYSVTEGMALFLSRELPAVYLKDGEDLICLRERQETDGINGAALSAGRHKI